MLSYEPWSAVVLTALVEIFYAFIITTPIAFFAAIAIAGFIMLSRGAIRDWWRQVRLLFTVIGESLRPIAVPATAAIAMVGFSGTAYVLFEKSFRSAPDIAQAQIAPFALNAQSDVVTDTAPPIITARTIEVTALTDSDEIREPLPIPVNDADQLGDDQSLPVDPAAAALVMNARVVAEYDLVRAVSMLERARRRVPHDSVIWKELAQAYGRLGDPAVAAAAWAESNARDGTGAPQTDTGKPPLPNVAQMIAPTLATDHPLLPTTPRLISTDWIEKPDLHGIQHPEGSQEPQAAASVTQAEPADGHSVLSDVIEGQFKPSLKGKDTAATQPEPAEKKAPKEIEL